MGVTDSNKALVYFSIYQVPFLLLFCFLCVRRDSTKPSPIPSGWFSFFAPSLWHFRWPQVIAAWLSPGLRELPGASAPMHGGSNKDVARNFSAWNPMKSDWWTFYFHPHRIWVQRVPNWNSYPCVYGSKLKHHDMDRNCWSLFPFTRVPFWGYPILSHTHVCFCCFPSKHTPRSQICGFNFQNKIEDPQNGRNVHLIFPLASTIWSYDFESASNTQGMASMFRMGTGGGLEVVWLGRRVSNLRLNAAKFQYLGLSKRPNIVISFP